MNNNTIFLFKWKKNGIIYRRLCKSQWTGTKFITQGSGLVWEEDTHRPDTPQRCALWKNDIKPNPVWSLPEVMFSSQALIIILRKLILQWRVVVVVALYLVIFGFLVVFLAKSLGMVIDICWISSKGGHGCAMFFLFIMVDDLLVHCGMFNICNSCIL